MCISLYLFINMLCAECIVVSFPLLSLNIMNAFQFRDHSMQFFYFIFSFVCVLHTLFWKNKYQKQTAVILKNISIKIQINGGFKRWETVISMTVMMVLNYCCSFFSDIYDECNILFACVDFTSFNTSATRHFTAPFEHASTVDCFVYDFVIVASIAAQ